MKSAEIKEYLGRARNNVELIAMAAELKRNGEKEVTVNKIVSELRKARLRQSKKIPPLPKTIIPDITNEARTELMFSTDYLSKPIIVYTGQAIII